MKIQDLLLEGLRGKTLYAKGLIQKAPPKYVVMQLLDRVIGRDPTSIRRIVQNLTHHLDGIDKDLVRGGLEALQSDNKIKRLDGNVEAYQRVT